VQLSPTSERPLVICALEFERRRLLRSSVATRADIECVGPGEAAMVAWAERLGESSRLIVLAGLAGSLRSTWRPGAVALAGTVVGRDGRTFHAATARRLGEVMQRQGTATDVGHTLPGVVLPGVVAASPTVLTDPAAKRALAEATGADLVDQESAAFALAASILGWRWLVVKGVSDGHQQHLPHDLGRWVDAAGRTRLLRTARSLALRPWRIPGVLRLGRDSARAMDALDWMFRGLALSDAISGPARDAEPDTAPGAVVS
jgi:adenosylhomocysteine nucleosidase